MKNIFEKKVHITYLGGSEDKNVCGFNRKTNWINK